MPTITIGEFVLKFGLDPSQYEAGAKRIREQNKKTQDESKVAGREQEERAKRSKEALSSLRNEVLSTAASIAGITSITKFTAQTVTNFTQIGIQARLAGQNVSQFVAVANAVARNGGDAKATQNSLAGLSSALELYRDFGQGDPRLIGAIGAIGGSASDSSEEILKKLADYSQHHTAQQTAAIGRLIGFDDGTINTALKGRKALNAEIAESYRLGVPKQSDIDKLTQMNKAFQTFRQGIAGAGQHLIEDFANPFNNILGGIDRFVEKEPKITEGIVAIGAAFAAWKSLAAPAWIARLLGLGSGAAATEGSVAATVAAGGASLLAVGAGVAAGVGVAAYGGGMDKNEDRNFIAGQAKAFFQKTGLSADQASGIASGIFAEGGSINAASGPYGAYGIGQWVGDRKRALFAKYGAHPTLQQQLEFMNWELHGGDPGKGGASVLAQKTAAGTSAAYLKNFMRPTPKNGDPRPLLGDMRRASGYLSKHGYAGGQSTVSIGSIVINTQATDARGIARDLNGQIALQANRGLQ